MAQSRRNEQKCPFLPISLGEQDGETGLVGEKTGIKVTGMQVRLRIPKIYFLVPMSLGDIF